ncbi:helix-turn-helix domain-containing protein [Hymenobacter guriensis]|uniref:Helix-turn-helix domain-containing protein n=1 Tax=Hymenobacter guriensis TaxID=2793065 RepID=A0ABS0L479_9BACT|nr:helix-turn-helix domain-containing protein [Hymenobacter guriensis]
MQTILTTGVTYSQLLDDLRAIIRHEVTAQGPASAETAEAASPELLTVRDAATLLDVCPATIHDWKRRGILPYHKIGGRTYLKRADLLNALQAHQRTAKPTGKGGARRG